MYCWLVVSFWYQSSCFETYVGVHIYFMTISRMLSIDQCSIGVQILSHVASLRHIKLSVMCSWVYPCLPWTQLSFSEGCSGNSITINSYNYYGFIFHLNVLRYTLTTNWRGSHNMTLCKNQAAIIATDKASGEFPGGSTRTHCKSSRTQTISNIGKPSIDFICYNILRNHFQELGA